MVTADEIAGIDVFAGVGAAGRERLSRAVADISLVAGEYAVDEGGERALFAVLDGRIEAVKRVDGIERVVGQRHPGDVFGEVPIALGTVFPVGFRVAGPTRVMRLEPHDDHAVAAVAAVAPDVGEQIGKPARRRMSGSRAAGNRGRAAFATCDRGRPSPGSSVLGVARVPRSQPDHVHLADAGRTGRNGAVGRTLACRRDRSSAGGRTAGPRYGPRAARP